VESTQNVPDTSRISFTALYTGYVWYKHGLSDEILKTEQGAWLYRSLKPFNALANRLSPGLSLETMLLQRHALIDHFLTEAIAENGSLQIIEVAAGLSPRGLRV